jgi:hypothetical protein
MSNPERTVATGTELVTAPRPGLARSASRCTNVRLSSRHAQKTGNTHNQRFTLGNNIFSTLTIVKVATPLEFVSVRYLLTCREHGL